MRVWSRHLVESVRCQRTFTISYPVVSKGDERHERTKVEKTTNYSWKKSMRLFLDGIQISAGKYVHRHIFQDCGQSGNNCPECGQFKNAFQNLDPL